MAVKSNRRLLVYVLVHDSYGVIAADYCPVRLDRFARRIPGGSELLKIYRLSGMASLLDCDDCLELCPVCPDDCRDGLIKGYRDECC